MCAVLNRIDRAVGRCEYALLVFLMAALTLILVAQVVCRYFFGSPIFWAEDVAVQILTLATCIGVSYLIYRNDMIKVDFLLVMMPPAAVALMQRAVYLAGFIVLAVMACYAAEWVMRPENRFVVSPTTGLLKWYNYLGIAASFFLMAWHTLVKLFAPAGAAAQAVAEGESC